MRIQKQEFLAHTNNIDKDYRIFYYSDIKSNHLYFHTHNFYEMYLLVSGKVVYQTGGSEFHLRPGDILFIGVGQRHCPFLIDPSVPYERIVLHVNPSILEELSDSTTNLAECFTRDNYVVYHFGQDVQDNIRLLLGKLFNLQEIDQFGEHLLAKAHLTELFVEINQYNNDKTVYTLSYDMKNMQMVAAIKQYINENLDEDITIDELAEYAYLSRGHFMNTFKEITGLSAYQYVQKARLKAASSLIMEGATLTQASLECGFNDYSSFYRAFQKEYNKSPREYFESNLSWHYVTNNIYLI